MSKLFVLSVDGFETQDLEFMSTLPNFSKLLKKAAVVKNVKEVYPTLTYVIHTTILTGVTPDKHGIYHNVTPYIPNIHENWQKRGYNWKMFSDEIKAETLFDAAKKRGLSTACVMWPVMGGQVPDHNLAEIWPGMCGTLRETYEKSCTQSVMELYYDKYVANFDWAHTLDTDSYSVDVTCDMVKRFKPDLMMEHAINLDYSRHYTGNATPKVFDSLRRVDGFVGKLLDAYREAGIYDETNFVILGDHGQENVDQQVNLNVLFVKEGLITLNDEGIATDYDAFVFTNGFSAYVRLKNPDDEAMVKRVEAFLRQIQAEYPWFIEHIYTAHEALEQEHLSGDFSFVLEGRMGISLEEKLTGPLSCHIHQPEFNTYLGNHGYHPSKGPKPPFIAFGPDIKEGITLEGAALLDECPTLAKLLGVEMQEMMGKPLPIFKG